MHFHLLVILPLSMSKRQAYTPAKIYMHTDTMIPCHHIQISAFKAILTRSLALSPELILSDTRVEYKTSE